MNVQADRSGVMLLRAWMHEGQVVARVQSSLAGEAEQQSRIALGIDQIEETLREWLRDLSETES